MSGQCLKENRTHGRSAGSEVTLAGPSLRVHEIKTGHTPNFDLIQTRYAALLSR